MNKKDYKTIAITSAICLIPIIFGLLVYDKLPDQVAIHWGPAGTADGFADKFVAVVLLPFLLAGVNCILQFFVYNDPKRKNISNKMSTITIWTIPAVAIVVQTMVLLVALGVDVNVSMLVPLVVGALLIVLGNYMPKCKVNYTVGIRLPWTLANEEVWNKTHRLAGFLYVLSGLALIINTLLVVVNVIGLIIAIVILMVVVPAIYSFVLYKKIVK